MHVRSIGLLGGLHIESGDPLKILWLAFVQAQSK
jgi:hypothetical protein